MRPPLCPGSSPRSPGSDGFDSQHRRWVPKRAPTRAGNSIFFQVLFNTEQTLPPFPASMGAPDGYPLLRLALEMGILFMASAQNLALGPFLLRADHIYFEGPLVGPLRDIRSLLIQAAGSSRPDTRQHRRAYKKIIQMTQHRPAAITATLAASM